MCFTFLVAAVAVIVSGFFDYLNPHDGRSLTCVYYSRVWCEEQDSNLRTVTDWDLIPAPLTSLGDPRAVDVPDSSGI